MGESTERCAVCGQSEGPGPALKGAGLSRVIIEGRVLLLCRAHAATVVAAMPETFDEMRTLFVGVASADRPARGAGMPVERRSPIQRRDAEDRRVFPPRPEGRRRGAGRRATDIYE